MSSNVARNKTRYRKLATRLCPSYRTLRICAKTGIELPGETSGLVASWRNGSHRRLARFAMGQEVGITPLQMAAHMGAIANMVFESLRTFARDQGCRTLVPRDYPRANSCCQRRHCATVRGMLEGVTLNGTAKRAQLEGYSAAGRPVQLKKSTL